MTSDRKFQIPSGQQLNWRQTNFQGLRVYKSPEAREMSNITAALACFENARSFCAQTCKVKQQHILLAIGDYTKLYLACLR